MFKTNLFKYWTYQVFAPGTLLREKYEAYKSLLGYDKRAHELMAELEEIYHNKTRVDFKVIEERYNEFSHCVSRMVQDLAKMRPTRYLDLKAYFKKFNFYVRFMLSPPEFDFSPPFTIPLSKIPRAGHALTGGKALNLAIIGEKLRLPVPKGFVITTNAFYYFIEFNDLRKSIDEILVKLDIDSTASLDTASQKLINIIMNAQIPLDIEEEILQLFRAVKWDKCKNARIALRSSAVAEDAKSSFAGQYKTVLNVNEERIIDAYKEVIASKYSSRALFYRINYGLSDMETPMAVLALEMIDAEASGIIYTSDLEDPDSKSLNIHSIWGIGELVVGGEVSPDIINIEKKPIPRITGKKASVKPKQMVFSQNNITEIIPVCDDKKKIFSLDDASALELAEWGMKLEKFFKEPQDVEWAKDSLGRLFLLQSRPLKLEEIHSKAVECNFEHIENALLISGGETACSGIGAGKVFRIDRESDLANLPKGAVLVAENASPHYVKVMDKLSAIITDTGSKAGHFASVAREFGVPALVNTGVATDNLPEGRDVTVYADGKVVYDGIVQSMIESPCAKKDLMLDSPFMRKLEYVMSFISPLKLLDPQDPSFVAHGVGSLHDIIRFVHEKAVQEMFLIGEKRIRKLGGAKKLISELPMLFYVVDVSGCGLRQNKADKKTIMMDDIISIPMRAVFKGLTHPEIVWSEFTHFDWAEYDKIAMSGGIISAESAIFASYAVFSHDYLNLNLRFGYHFVILDTICGDKAEDNYILFRFSGGGADIDKRMLRADFLSKILDRLGFKVDMINDLVDGELKGGVKKSIERKLDIIGRLLGATRLMDMYLKDSKMVETYVEEFMNEQYHFASVEM